MNITRVAYLVGLDGNRTSIEGTSLEIHLGEGRVLCVSLDAPQSDFRKDAVAISCDTHERKKGDVITHASCLVVRPRAGNGLDITIERSELPKPIRI